MIYFERFTYVDSIGRVHLVAIGGDAKTWLRAFIIASTDPSAVGKTVPVQATDLKPRKVFDDAQLALLRRATPATTTTEAQAIEASARAELALRTARAIVAAAIIEGPAA